MTPLRRRAFVLPVVLVLVGLLALAMAGFIFFMRAEMSGTLAYADSQQARLAAESALEEVTALLRVAPHDATQWLDNPQMFRHALVWAETYDREGDPVRESSSRLAVLEQDIRVPAWRFSVVARSVSGLPDTMRYGITPESGKLNLNAATEEQVRQLFTPILLDLGLENADAMVNAFLDWRDDDDEPRDGGAENEFYNSLQPPYNTKNGRLDTVEELLLIRGFSPAVLYGEDVNRNGILDANEDDGDVTFPYYDNGDGVLNQGIAPYVTVYAREPDVMLEGNRPRINLNADAAQIAALTSQYFPDGQISGATLGFINSLKGQQGFSFSQLKSVAELYQGADLDQPPGEASGAGQPGALAGSPVTLEELPYLLDGFSIRPVEQAQSPLIGLINVNSAAAPVLQAIPGMTPDVAASIVATRSQLDAVSLRTPAWLLTAGVCDLATFHQIAPYLTTKAYQVHIEALGYADHVKLMRRYEWIVEMIGPLAQVRYYRDLTSLGLAWPIDNDDMVLGGGAGN